MASLDGRIALVTGGSGGIGHAVACALAEEGARLVLVARDPGRVSEATARLSAGGHDAIGVAIDVSDLAAVRGLPELLGERAEIDVLVNCIGLPRPHERSGNQRRAGLLPGE